MPSASKSKGVAASDRGATERTTELSEEVLQQLQETQQSAIGAVRRFMESVDDALPPQREGEHSRRQEVIDSALEMSQKLVKTQYEFLTGVVHSAGEALGSSSGRSSADGSGG